MSRFMTDEEIASEQELLRTNEQRIEQMNREHLEQAIAAGSIGPGGLTDDQVEAVSPLDLLSSDNYTDRATRDSRLTKCRGCERLFKPTATCRECGCFMAAKTWLKGAICPIGKWGPVS